MAKKEAGRTAAANKKKPRLSYADKPWLKHYTMNCPPKIAYKKIPLPEFLEASAREYPDHIALIFQGYTVTYRELKEMVDRFAACLSDFGIKKGDAVAILLPNCIPCVVAYYATLTIGGIAVMNNPLYSDRELEYQYRDSGAKVLVALDLLANRMINIRPNTKIKQIVHTSMGDYLPFPKNYLFPLVAKKKGLHADVQAAPEVYRWKECIAKYAPAPPKVEVKFEDTAVYQYTGGTTGVAKGAILTHKNLSCMVQMYQAWFKADRAGEIALSAPPIFHVLGMSAAMNLPISMAWTAVLVPKPQPKELLEAIRAYRPTMSPLVPTMYVGMLQHPDLKKTDLRCFKLMTSGGSSLPVEVLNRFKELTGVEINEGFGMTETSPQTHLNPYLGLSKVGSIGVPYPDTEVRIVDIETGRKEMPVGQAGEMIFRGPQITRGYLNKPEETKKSLKDGWLYSGDIAYMDEDGYFFVVDRKKDLIISSGYNVYPREIDEIFYEHPKVMKACAIGVPDMKRGENIKVFVVLKDGESATKEELMDFCRGRLATYKLPSEIEFRVQLPESTVGKILRKELRAEELGKRKS
ncbi:MAG: long-chain fatty acid--CoA ligase [Spirochaetes bacterium]|jgi:long-chain acyl-CoA synthetase|nr:long-chain fatty acid--CoA ligase [Spirochaetota bacterium]